MGKLDGKTAIVTGGATGIGSPRGVEPLGACVERGQNAALFECSNLSHKRER